MLPMPLDSSSGYRGVTFAGPLPFVGEAAPGLSGGSWPPAVARFRSDRTLPMLGCSDDARGRGGPFLAGLGLWIDFGLSLLPSSLSFFSSRFWRVRAGQTQTVSQSKANASVAQHNGNIQPRQTHLGLLHPLHVRARDVEVATKRRNDLEQLVGLHPRIPALAEIFQQSRELALGRVDPLAELGHLPYGAQREHPDFGGAQQGHLVLEAHGFDAEVVGIAVLRPRGGLLGGKLVDDLARAGLVQRELADVLELRFHLLQFADALVPVRLGGFRDGGQIVLEIQ